jgi:hypothetical protein
MFRERLLRVTPPHRAPCRRVSLCADARNRIGPELNAGDVPDTQLDRAIYDLMQPASKTLLDRRLMTIAGTHVSGVNHCMTDFGRRRSLPADPPHHEDVAVNL